MTAKKTLKELSQELDLPYLKDINGDVDQSLISKIPIAFAKKYEIFPLQEHEDHVLVATSNPLELYPFDDIRLVFKKTVSVAIAERSIIQDAINHYYAVGVDTAEQVMTDISDEDDLDSLQEPQDILDMGDEAPIIHLINTLLHQAVKDRASDIHFEPFERKLALRFRIDGVLYNIINPQKQYQPLILSRIKVMAGLNIAEKRLPQDGRIRLRIAGRDVDIRVSLIPTSFGERAVLRLLIRSEEVLNIEEIGMTDAIRTKIETLIHQSNGIVLVTGPTGSGKTTTLYSAISRINTDAKNIITVEDPVEYQLPGIGQIQVNTKIDLTFASGLRSILRQDPDVIMIGEIRDTETAEIAINASLTGHLVFSTLHTNDSAGAVTRLVDMGIEPFLISSSLSAIIAQRLVRLLCTSCRLPYEPTREELLELAIKPEDLSGTIYKSVGCIHCKDTGYKGRIGIYELLIVNDKIRHLINEKADSKELRNVAVTNGMRMLKQEGIEKVLQGVTTFEEVLRVTQEESIA